MHGLSVSPERLALLRAQRNAHLAHEQQQDNARREQAERRRKTFRDLGAELAIAHLDFAALTELVSLSEISVVSRCRCRGTARVIDLFVAPFEGRDQLLNARACNFEHTASDVIEIIVGAKTVLELVNPSPRTAG
jgi:hypothetical protein